MTSKRSTPEPTKTHPIKVVARRTGLTADVIRVWERRYHAVEPHRAKGKRRLYTDEEVEQLLLLRKVTRAGRRIGDVARLDSDQLRTMVAEDERAVAAAAEASAPVGSRARGQAPVLRECFQAIDDLNAEALEAALLRASVELSETELLDRVVLPLMHQVGERWHDGSLRVMHEHLTTSVVRSLLGSTRPSRALPANAPVVVVTTPAGQLHELGALAVALSAGREGWNVTYLGPDVPAEDIAAAVQHGGARMIALSIIHPADDPHLVDELRRLRKLVGEEVRIVVGGRAAQGYRQVLEATGAVLPGSLSDLRSMMEELRLRQQ